MNTANTLRANVLEPTELICEITSRLIVNRASMNTRQKEIGEILQAIEAAVDANQEQAQSATE